MASNKNHALLFMSNDILISIGTYKRIYHYWKQDKNKIEFNIITKSIAVVFNTIIRMNLDTDMTPIYSLWNGKMYLGATAFKTNIYIHFDIYFNEIFLYHRWSLLSHMILAFLRGTARKHVIYYTSAAK